LFLRCFSHTLRIRTTSRRLRISLIEPIEIAIALPCGGGFWFQFRMDSHKLPANKLDEAPITPKSTLLVAPDVEECWRQAPLHCQPYPRITVFPEALPRATCVFLGLSNSTMATCFKIRAFVSGRLTRGRALCRCHASRPGSRRDALLGTVLTAGICMPTEAPAGVYVPLCFVLVPILGCAQVDNF
jgi:hypothetical protein